MNEWVMDLKPDDKVIVNGIGYGGRGNAIGTVKRLTKTQVLVQLDSFDHEYRFKRDSGWSIGGSTWFRKYLRQYNDEEAAKITDTEANKRSHLIRLIGDAPLANVSTANLEQVVGLLKEGTDEPTI